MKITGSAIRLGVYCLVLLTFTALIVVVFGQIRFDRTTGFFAVFTNASGLRAGQFVRASGVEVGKVAAVDVIDGGQHVQVAFTVERTLPLYQSTTALIRYQDLIGNRYLELQRGDSTQPLKPGATIPIERTQPALDLDALIGGFRPLFRSLDAQKVNSIARSLITVLQGQGGTITDILDQTAQFTSQLADQDKIVGQLIDNLNTVLGTAVAHQQQFDQTLKNFQLLVTGLANRKDPLAAAVAHISDASGTVADLLANERPVLKDTVNRLQEIAVPLIGQRDYLDDVLTRWPGAFKIIGRAGGIYGDFFNFYLCDITLKINGLQPGGPVRTVRLFQQPTGRCTPQ